MRASPPLAAALRRLYVRCRRSAPLGAALRRSAPLGAALRRSAPLCAARRRSALPLLRVASPPRRVTHRTPPRRLLPRRSLTARCRAARAACSLRRRPPLRSSLTAPLARRQLAHRQPTRRTPPCRSRSASLTAPLAHFCLSRRVAPSVPTLHRVARAPLAAPSAPLARRITHCTARRLPPRRCHHAARHRALRMSTA